MKKIIVTSGETFADIDAFACAIAYAELLRLEGNDAEAVLPGTLNHSITPTIRAWGLSFSTQPSATGYSSVLVDVSEPAHVARCAPPESVTEIYDHRYGFEKIWRDRLGENCHIEPVGACTTLIWEEFKRRGFADRISAKSANLLLIGTVSNTLNFGAQVTTERDIRAAKELESRIDLPKDWKETYFKEQEETALKDPENTIRNDTKTLDIPGLGLPLVMGQLELWDSRDFLGNHQDKIRRVLASYNVEDWFMSLPCIKERINYVYAENERVKALLGEIIDARFEGNIGKTDKMWLRKEVRKRLLQLHEK